MTLSELISLDDIEDNITKLATVQAITRQCCLEFSLISLKQFQTRISYKVTLKLFNKIKEISEPTENEKKIKN